MRFKNSPQLPRAGRTRARHHDGSDTPTSPRTIYVLKSANGGLFYTPLYLPKILTSYVNAPKQEALIIRNFTVNHCPRPAFTP